MLGMAATAEILNPWADDVLFYLTAVATVIAGVQYLYRGLLWLQNRVTVS